MTMGAEPTQKKTDKETWLLVSREIMAGRRYIVAATILAFIAGVWSAIMSPKTYEASAVIAPKKTNSGSGVLSQLGGLGGMISSQMGLASTGNERLAFTLTTREVIGQVITEQNLMPKLYPGFWDGAKGTWKSQDSTRRPSMQEAIEEVRENLVHTAINTKRELVVISVILKDSAAVAPVVESFLNALNESIKGRVRKDAEANRLYLEGQLSITSDPLLREKLQSLIGGEIEKSMILGSWAFDVLEPPVPPLIKNGPNRKKIVAMAVSVGFFGSAILVVLFQRLLPLLVFLRKLKWV